MKNIITIFFVIFLILFTALIKNSSKKLETQIYNLRENLSILNEKYNYVFLENNYLSSPEKLSEIKNSIFNDEYISLEITDLNLIKEKNGKFVIQKFYKDE
jgi:hypothetical protein